MKKLVLTPLLALMTAPAVAADSTRAVGAGEHGTYSRVVIPPGSGRITLDQQGRKLRLLGVAPQATFTFADINERHKAHRVDNARLINTGAGAVIELTLNCDCAVSTSRLSNGKFIVDVRDATSANGAKEKKPATATSFQKAKTKKPSKTDVLSVEQAHNRVVALLKQAAQDGLIDLKNDGPSLTSAEKSPTVLTPNDNTKDQAGEDTHKQTDHEKLADATVHSDARDTEAALATTQAQPISHNEAGQCYSDADLYIDGSAFEESPMVAISELQAKLAGAEGEGQKAVALELAAGFLSIGFGDEALALLKDHGLSKTPLSQLATIVSEKPLPEDSLLKTSLPCDGAHALWLAVDSAPEDGVAHFHRSGDQINSIPRRLRAIVATRLAMSMVEAEAWAEAQILHEIATEASSAPSPQLDYILALIEAHDGEIATSRDRLVELAESNTNAANDALLALADSYATTHDAPHDGFKEDIGALAKTTKSTQAILAEARAWADVGNVDAALILLKGVTAKSPSEAHVADAAARTILANAFENSDTLGKVSALDAYLANKEWVVADDDANQLQQIASAAATDLGVPNLAYSILSDDDAPLSDNQAMIKARAALSSGDEAEAIKIAAPHMGDPAFAEIVVDANIQKGAYHDALAATALFKGNAAYATTAAKAAWLARSWPNVSQSMKAIQPESLTPRLALQNALAAYMSGEDQLPPSAEAILSVENETLARGAASMLARRSTGTILQRSRQSVARTQDEIQMFEEILSDG